jgi:hypothetical protein
MPGAGRMSLAARFWSSTAWLWWLHQHVAEPLHQCMPWVRRQNAAARRHLAG